jgi:hypothetical protein
MTSSAVVGASSPRLHRRGSFALCDMTPSGLAICDSADSQLDGYARVDVRRAGAVSPVRQRRSANGWLRSATAASSTAVAAMQAAMAGSLSAQRLSRLGMVRSLRF